MLTQITEEKIKDIKFSPLDKEGKIVAYGETSGHRHIVQVAEKSNAIVEVDEDKNGFYFKIAGGDVEIKHDTHKPVILSPGIWFVAPQYEYDEVEERKKVID